MKSFMKWFIEINNWLMQNMNKFYLWVFVVLFTVSAIGYYEVNHPMNSLVFFGIIIFSAYTEFKIIFEMV